MRGGPGGLCHGLTREVPLSERGVSCGNGGGRSHRRRPCRHRRSGNALSGKVLRVSGGVPLDDPTHCGLNGVRGLRAGRLRPAALLSGQPTGRRGYRGLSGFGSAWTIRAGPRRSNPRATGPLIVGPSLGGPGARCGPVRRGCHSSREIGCVLTQPLAVEPKALSPQQIGPILGGGRVERQVQAERALLPVRAPGHEDTLLDEVDDSLVGTALVEPLGMCQESLTGDVRLAGIRAPVRQPWSVHQQDLQGRDQGFSWQPVARAVRWGGHLGILSWSARTPLGGGAGAVTGTSGVRQGQVSLRPGPSGMVRGGGPMPSMEANQVRTPTT